MITINLNQQPDVHEAFLRGTDEIKKQENRIRNLYWRVFWNDKGSACIKERQRNFDTKYREQTLDVIVEPSDMGKLAGELLPSPSCILVLGSGAGNDPVYLAREGHTVTAIDLSPVGIEKTSEWSQKLGVYRKVFAMSMDITNPKAMGGIKTEYDAIVCSRVLHCLPWLDRGFVVEWMQSHTINQGYNFISVCVEPDMSNRKNDASFGLYSWALGQLEHRYEGWLQRYKGTSEMPLHDDNDDRGPHTHTFEDMILQKPLITIK